MRQLIRRLEDDLAQAQAQIAQGSGAGLRATGKPSSATASASSKDAEKKVAQLEKKLAALKKSKDDEAAARTTAEARVEKLTKEIKGSRPATISKAKVTELTERCEELEARTKHQVGVFVSVVDCFMPSLLPALLLCSPTCICSPSCCVMSPSRRVARWCVSRSKH